MFPLLLSANALVTSQLQYEIEHVCADRCFCVCAVFSAATDECVRLTGYHRAVPVLVVVAVLQSCGIVTVLQIGVTNHLRKTSKTCKQL